MIRPNEVDVPSPVDLSDFRSATGTGLELTDTTAGTGRVQELGDVRKRKAPPRAAGHDPARLSARTGADSR